MKLIFMQHRYDCSTTFSVGRNNHNLFLIKI